MTDGAGGKGTWGKLLDVDGESHIDRNDPNYDSGEVIAAFHLFLLSQNHNALLEALIVAHFLYFTMHASYFGNFRSYFLFQL